MKQPLATREKSQLITLISAIPLITTILSLLLSLDPVTAKNNHQPQPATYQRPNSGGQAQLMVAMYCGSNGEHGEPDTLYHNQYLDIETRKWLSDRDANSFCTLDKQKVHSYCRKVYPNHDIRNIVESSRSYRIDNWCKVGSSKRKCRGRFTVKPYRCLEGTFQSDALLVPERCLFDHVHNKSICESSDHWNKTASENCQNKGMKLESFAMLQPCGLSIFSGVEFVCCPKQQQSDEKRKPDQLISTKPTDGNSFAQAAYGPQNWPKDSKYDSEEKFNEVKVEEDNAKKHEKEKNNADTDEDDEYEYDEDEYDDDSSSWYGDKSTSTSAPTTSTTTTTTTQRPIDHYLSHFDIAHEHEEFRKAELAVENSYREKITNVMKEWSQLDSRYEEMKAKDPQAAEQFKKKMTHEFQRTVEALEEEGNAQRHQLASMHAERAMALINRRKKSAMDCLTQALDKMPIRTHQVEKCIVKLLKALEKDRTHTLRQYKNLLVLNTREALREKKIILDHLVTLNRAANQSIAMLDRSPLLVENLKGKVIALLHKLRDIPLDQPIDRDSEAKIMEKYEEEVAQRKIEQERQRLGDQEAVSDSPQESLNKQAVDDTKQASNSDSNNAGTEPVTQATVNTNRPEPINPTTSAPSPIRSAPSGPQARSDEHENEIHYQIDSAKFSHLKMDPSHHELSYSVRHEPIDGQRRFLHPNLMIVACTVVIALALFGFKHYNKYSSRAYKRQGFAEVGRSCPEEKTVANLQFNGYENPAYKFFEAEA